MICYARYIIFIYKNFWSSVFLSLLHTQYLHSKTVGSYPEPDHRSVGQVHTRAVCIRDQRNRKDFRIGSRGNPWAKYSL